MTRREIKIEGYTADEILALPDRSFCDFVFTSEPVIFLAGSAEILGEFRVEGDRLVIELAEVNGGGEGVLPVLSGIAARFARSRGLAHVEWIVHAITCAKPNSKLRRVLERRGFEVRSLAGIGDAYHLVVPTGTEPG